MFKKILAVTALAVLLAAGQAQATKPLQLALVEEIQLVPADESIKGLRLNIYGVNDDMMGLSLGFVHKSTGNTSGAELGLVGITEGDFHGWQASFLYSETKGRFIGLQSGIVGVTGGDFTGVQYSYVSMTKGRFKGLQTGIVAITRGDFSGWQYGIVNWTDGRFIGAQTGIANIDRGDLSGVQLGGFNKVDGKLKGVQVGFVNCTGETNGLQLGFINHSKKLNDGLQIGLGNINENKDPFGFLPFVNWSF